MNKLNFKSIINTNRTNRNTKNITTNSNYDLTTTINLNSKKGQSKNKKNLELKTKVDKYDITIQCPENNPYNTIGSTVTPNFVRNQPQADLRSFKSQKHKKNSSEIPISHSNMDLIIDNNKLGKFLNDDREMQKVNISLFSY
jgi:hypothetical protein